MINKFKYLFINQLNFLFSYLLIVFIASKLSVDEFGTLTYIKNIIAFSIIFLMFGLDRSSLHLFSKKPFEMYGYANILKLILYIFIVVILMILNLFQFIKISFDIFIVISLIIFVFVFDIKYMFDITKTVEYEIYFSYLKLIPITVYLLMSYFYEFKIETIDYFICTFLGLFIYIVSQYLFFKIKPKLNYDKDNLKVIIKYTNYVWIGAIFSSINNYADSFMIMHYLGSEITGIYNFAYMFYIGLLMITSLLVRFFISDSLQLNISLKDVHYYSIKMFLFSLIIFLISYYIYPIFINMFFINYIDSIEVFYILSFSFIFVSVTSIYGNLLISKGKSNYYAFSMGITALVNIIFNYIFIQIYGAVGAASITLFATIIAAVLTYYFFRKELI